MPGGCLAPADYTTSGIILKDRVVVDAYPDPKIDGITVYVSSCRDASLSVKKFFVDPASSSVSIAQTGPIVFREPIETSKAGEDIVSESKNLAFKSMKVRRIFDPIANSLVYVSYTSKLR